MPPKRLPPPYRPPQPPNLNKPVLPYHGWVYDQLRKCSLKGEDYQQCKRGMLTQWHKNRMREFRQRYIDKYPVGKVFEAMVPDGTWHRARVLTHIPDNQAVKAEFLKPISLYGKMVKVTCVLWSEMDELRSKRSRFTEVLEAVDDG